MTRGADRRFRLGSRFAWIAAMLVIAVLGVMKPQLAHAQVNCSATYDPDKRYCVPPIITPWEWTASYGVYYWGPYASEAEATSAGVAGVTQIWTTPPNTSCSISYNSTAYDIYPIVYDAGVDVQHGHGVSVNRVISTDETPPCTHGGVGPGVTLNQLRFVRCPVRPPGQSQFGLFWNPSDPSTPVCGIPWTRPHKVRCDSCQQKAGDSTELSTGVKSESGTDYSGSGPSPLGFRRTYRSDSAYANASNYGSSTHERLPLGAGWSANYFQRIEINSAAGNVAATAYRPDGLPIIFRFDGTNYVPDDDESTRLTKLLDGGGNHIGWQLEDGRDTTETYDASGRLSSIKDRAGRAQTVAYASASAVFPSSVQDDFGHTISFGYDSTLPWPRLTTVTLPDTTQISYTYSAKNNLISVTYPDTKSLTYHYELDTGGGFYQSHLTGVTTENGVRFSTITYDGNGVSSTELAGGVAHYDFNFAQLFNSGSANVVDPLGRSRWYTHSIVAGTVRLTGSTGLCPGCSVPKSQEYDTDGNITSKRDFNDNLSCYAYDTSRNLETIRIEGFAPATAACPSNLATYTPATGTLERKIVTAWNATFRLPDSITEANRTTSFTYDTNGNILTRTVTDTSVSPNVSRTSTYTYNSYGQVLTEDGPRTDVSDVTT